MGDSEKPRVVVSQCLGFAPCRYDGEIIRSTAAERLAGEVEFLPVCPEMAIGLGCPRDPIRVVRTGGERRLVQPATGRDVSAVMRGFARRFLDAAGPVDGFLLKARSPSCGIRDVKVYDGPEGEALRREGPGLFAEAVLARFPAAAVEDELGLDDAAACDRWLQGLRAAAATRRGG